MVAWSAAAVAFVALVGFYTASACNEAVCASIVSKCMLTQSCKCELRNCTCCKECFNCLDYLYAECCSCVGRSRPYSFDPLATLSLITTA